MLAETETPIFSRHTGRHTELPLSQENLSILNGMHKITNVIKPILPTIRSYSRIRYQNEQTNESLKLQNMYNVSMQKENLSENLKAFLTEKKEINQNLNVMSKRKEDEIKDITKGAVLSINASPVASQHTQSRSEIEITDNSPSVTISIFGALSEILSHTESSNKINTVTSTTTTTTAPISKLIKEKNIVLKVQLKDDHTSDFIASSDNPMENVHNNTGKTFKEAHIDKNRNGSFFRC